MCPRGDLCYNSNESARMRPRSGMPPSHNTVWVESDVTQEELTGNWNKTFGEKKEKTNGGWECTCNWHEVSVNNKMVMTRDACKIHGKAERIVAKVTDVPKKFSKSHMKKVQEHIFYGKGDGRALLQ